MRFINPYNFVPLEENCIRRSLTEYRCSDEPLLTGYMECTLETLTPLIIPNTSNNQGLHQSDGETGGKSYDFFSYSNHEFSPAGVAINRFDKPVIPGSALRGVIRSVYEAAFNGCLSTVDMNRKLHRRTTKPKKAGLLRRRAQGDWEVVECERVMLNVKCSDERRYGKKVPPDIYRKWEEGDEISVLKSDLNYVTSRGYKTDFRVAMDFKKGEKKGERWEQGYLHKGEPFSRKHHESVFVPNKNNKSFLLASGELDRLKELLRQYADIQINRHNKDGKHSGYVGWKERFENLEESSMETISLPVYFSIQIENSEQYAMYLTPAMISKEVFQTGIKQLLRDNGGYQPCDNRDMLCPACALFGMSGERSLASRVRFSDANVSGDDMAQYDLLLPELGEPKPGTVEFYSVFPGNRKPEQDMYPYWTYDYITTNSGKVRSLGKKELQIRGRKFYWHHEPTKETIGKSNPSGKRGDVSNSMVKRVRAVSAGTDFSFRVYFDAVTKEELEHLHWALTFEDTGCAHKIGHGKPLGYGSATIRVTQIMVRRLDPETGERSIRDEKQRIMQTNHLSETPSMALMKKIASWTNKPSEKVSYPLGEGNKKSGESNMTASHQWFGINRKKEGFSRVLPTIEEELDENASGKWLCKLEKSASNTKPRHGKPR